MLSLSLFMMDPLKAHEEYKKEVDRIRKKEKKAWKDRVDNLEEEVKTLKKENEGMRKGHKKIQEKNRQQKAQVKALHEKLEG